MPALTDPFQLGPHRVAGRVLLAPLAGIGNWFVRLQARRHGAAMAFSEMVSSHAVHHGNERTCRELLRIHPDEGLVAIQLFGSDPEVMRSAAERVAAAGADVIDLNMGCPVPKVCKTGAGAALLGDHDRAIAVARAAREASGLPVTVKLRSGQQPGGTEGIRLARRLVAEAQVAAITLHPRSARVQHAGRPDYGLVAELVQTLPVPVILSGGLRDPQSARAAFEQTGAAAIVLARGSLGNPWLFEELLGRRSGPPTTGEVLAELDWVLARGVEHLGLARATRYLRKFYPWYVERLGLDRRSARALSGATQVAESIDRARALMEQAVLVGA